MLGYDDYDNKLQRTSIEIHVNVYLVGGNCEQSISLSTVNIQKLGVILFLTFVTAVNLYECHDCSH